MRKKYHALWMMGALAGFWGLGLPELLAEPLTEPLAEPRSGPVVVELFTSQSCSSCPPADRMLESLNRHDNVIALGCHVTYWDFLNWKDTLSLPACTQRQRAYAAAFGSRQVYTPQMVVNGAVEFVGSNQGRALQEIGRAGQNATVKLIPLNQTADGLSATLPQLHLNQPPLTLWLVAYGTDHTQAIRSGENRGRSVAYVNPVTRMENVGTWTGAAESRTIALPPGLSHDTGGYALLAQATPLGPILAAGKAPLFER